MSVGSRHVLCVAALLWLSACASTPPDTFDLASDRTKIAARVPHGVILVAEPLAIAPADGDRIVIRTGPDSIATLKGAQWVDRAPRLLQARIIQTFENAGLMRFVTRPEDALAADERLVIEVRRFEIDASAQEAVIELAARLVTQQSGRVIAAQVFSVHAPGSTRDGASAADALSGVTGAVVRQLVAWAAAHG